MRTSHLKKSAIALLVFGLFFCGLFGLPLTIGIWLPDVFFARPQTLAEQKLASGHSFRVIQYWNHCDFYNTELLHTFPNNTVTTHVLDGDDGKSWSVPLVVDEQNKTATVILRGGRKKQINWR